MSDRPSKPDRLPLDTVPLSPTIHPWLAWIAEPRMISLVLGVFHLAAMSAGLAAIMVPDDYYWTHALGAVSSDFWGASLFLGGTFGVIGCLPGVWWLERCGLILEVFGVLAYEVAIWCLMRDPAPLVAYRTGLGVMCQVACLNRFLRISGAYLDPRRGHNHRPVVDRSMPVQHG